MSAMSLEKKLDRRPLHLLRQLSQVWGQWAASNASLLRTRGGH